MKFAKLVISILICQLAGIVGSVYTRSAVKSWYPTLVKPGFTPPDWVFAPVWITLFTIMGISLYLIWNKEDSGRKKIALMFFWIQLLFNTFWSMLFFGLKSPLYALIEIALLWGAILMTIIKFHKVSKPAAYLLVPYILWVSFAAILNFSIFILN